jgi:PEP-CTERM motif
MKRSLLYALPALLLFAGSQARADISWHADWDPGSLALTVGPSSVIDFTNLHGSAYTTTALQPVISTPVTNLSIVTTASSSAPDVFSNKGYTLNLVITDDLSGLTHHFTFTGMLLSGSISTSGASVTNVFGPNATQSFTFSNGDKYVVSLDGYVPPGSGTNITTVGGIGADVTVTGPGSNGNTHATPEPTTLALAGLGMAFTGLVAWRKRRIQSA